MAKQKPRSLPNRAAYCRASYLYQAATYLATAGSASASTLAIPPADKPNTEAASPGGGGEDGACERDGKNVPESRLSRPPRLRGLSRALLTDLRTISQKSQFRLTPAVKHSVCKYCDTLLVEGRTVSSVVENRSKGGRKPWADVLVRTCRTCGGVKRFPVSAPRQKRRHERELEGREGETAAVSEGARNVPAIGNG